ncbi:reverse transcriptase (RNA-dependent DNA polymerase) domain-containing protein [Phthorimaea operculella]|nr:reverse transcriptase (RNA-dependent DNA polymerase) domain-containing protein [Phthorimaea operculella]
MAYNHRIYNSTRVIRVNTPRGDTPAPDALKVIIFAYRLALAVRAIRSGVRFAANLSFNGSPIPSQVGAQQGDPLGPLIFSLAIHKVVTSLKSKLNVWYLDDGTIGGTCESVADDVRTLVAGLEKMGLQVNSSKCEIFPCGEEANNNLATFDSLLPGVKTLNENTFSLLGAPIFSATIPSALEDKTRMIAQVREHLGHLSAHVALILFRACFSLPKLTYVIRTTPTWLFPEEVSVVDGAIRNTAESVINVTLDDNQWLQASLPIRYGGLGIRSIRAVSLPAFIASSNGVADLVADILKLQGERLSIPFQCDAVKAWAAACPGVDPPSKPESQRAWDDLSCKFSLSELSESLTGADVARIKAVTCPESGAWLQALPSPQLGTILDNDTLRIAVALRLGCGVCEDHSCPCGASVDSTGHHGLSCAKCAGRFPRHHALNEIIRRALVSANVPCVLEPPGLCRTDGKRPDGLTLVPWDKGRSLLWDATCVSTFAASHLPKTTREAGSAAEFAAGQKHIKYAELERNYLFVPFAGDHGAGKPRSLCGSLADACMTADATPAPERISHSTSRSPSSAATQRM